ncbi:MAG: UDP-N-acetylglucosamine 2-epimerase (non-hydrolyzing) [Chthonomonadales bacterium]|nr:UDP-N-acetylglucosamine 2-epimerase (non-hydrolyzing) [Chthonomonadales bacterium]
MKRLRAVCVFGTRPDAIKMAPVVRELRSAEEVWDVRTIVTGQHREQLDQVLGIFGITPDVDLAIMQPGQSLTAITTRALAGLDHALAAWPPDVVLAQGDTTTTFTAALAAFYNRVPFGHVEAGLRTGMIYDPFPEEMNRRLVAGLATWHFAPTEDARRNLLAEGIPSDRIDVTGNTGIDALVSVARMDGIDEDPGVERLGLGDSPIVLITAHRRENLGEPLAAICRAVRQLAHLFPETQFVYAMHKNPLVRETVIRELNGIRNVHLVEPPAYGPFIKLMQRSLLILTDSGGIQEEAPSLGRPVLVLRRTTERPEGVEAGATRLIGTQTETIIQETRSLLEDQGAYTRMQVSQNPYGDGQAAVRIRSRLETEIGR